MKQITSIHFEDGSVFDPEVFLKRNKSFIFLKAGLNNSNFREVNTNHPENGFIHTLAYAVGYSSKRLGLEKRWGVELDGGITKRGGLAYLSGTTVGGHNYYGTYVDGAFERDLTYISTSACVLLYPVNFFYLKAGANFCHLINYSAEPTLNSAIVDPQTEADYCKSTGGIVYGFGFFVAQGQQAAFRLGITAQNDFTKSGFVTGPVQYFNNSYMAEVSLCIYLFPNKKQAN